MKFKPAKNLSGEKPYHEFLLQGTFIGERLRRWSPTLRVLTSRRVVSTTYVLFVLEVGIIRTELLEYLMPSACAVPNFSVLLDIWR